MPITNPSHAARQHTVNHQLVGAEAVGFEHGRQVLGVLQYTKHFLFWLEQTLIHVCEVGHEVVAKLFAQLTSRDASHLDRGLHKDINMLVGIPRLVVESYLAEARKLYQSDPGAVVILNLQIAL